MRLNKIDSGEPEEPPDYYKNFDLDNIQTPINVSVLTQMLTHTQYDPAKVRFLQKGFTNGFDIGYRGPMKRRSQTSNIPLTIRMKTDLWNKLMKEVRLNCVAGPFDFIPFDSNMQSPIGLVPKSGGKTRLIFHLSYSFEKEDRLRSLNQHTPAEYCSVKYRDLDYAVHGYLKLANQFDQTKVQDTSSAQYNQQGKDRKTVKGGKTDIQSAFRLLPLLRRCWKWLVMKAQDPRTGTWKYFVDKCLPFGASISCASFRSSLMHFVIWLKSKLIPGD